MRVKRRKTLEKNPRLTILSYENESGEVECRLEISNKNNITFKFSLENDKPQEIAESLVRCQCYRIKENMWRVINEVRKRGERKLTRGYD